MTKNLDWFPLNHALADYGATFGAYVRGNSLLEVPGLGVVIPGHMTCGTRESAERHALDTGPGNRVSRAKLLSWKAQ